MLPLLYLIMLIECSFSQEREYLSNREDYHYLEELRTMPPKLAWYFQCYHHDPDNSGEIVVTHKDTVVN